MLTFQQFKIKLTQNVKLLAKKASEVYENRCTKQNAQCRLKPFNQCVGIDNKECISYGRLDGCAQNGAQVSKSSGVRFPSYINPDQLTNDQKLFVCASKQIDKTFKTIKESFGASISRQFVSTNFGFFQAYPGSQQIGTQGICTNDFDPRVRPWYVTATSGSKNVIIAIDISQSMDGSRLSKAKKLVNIIIQSLGLDDYVGVITFSDTANILGTKQTLIRATSTNKSTLLSLINSISTNRNTNYQNAFKKLEELLNKSKINQIGFRCLDPTNIVIFFTDGVPTSGSNTSQALITQINAWNSQYNIKLFAYTIGTLNDYGLLKNLACQYQGGLFTISDYDISSNVIDKINSYYTYVQNGVNITTPLWSQRYTDANTNQTMIAISMPIYYEENSKQKVLGAAAISVPFKYFQNYGITSQQQLLSLAPCVNTNISQCQLQNIRNPLQKCNISNCASFNQSNKYNCKYNVSGSVLGDPPVKGNMNRYECCGLTSSAQLAIIISFFVAFAIIILVVIGIYLYRKYQQKKLKQLASSSSSNNSNNGSSSIKHSTQESRKLLKQPNAVIEEELNTKKLLKQIQNNKIIGNIQNTESNQRMLQNKIKDEIEGQINQNLQDNIQCKITL